MSKYLDELERENDELRSLLREAAYEICSPYCQEETELKWEDAKDCGNCWVHRLVDASKKKREPEAILVLNTRRFSDGRGNLLPVVTLNLDVIRTLSKEELNGAKFALERAIKQLDE